MMRLWCLLMGHKTDVRFNLRGDKAWFWCPICRKEWR